MFLPNDQGLLPLLAISSVILSSGPSTPTRTRTRHARPGVRRFGPDLVRLIRGVTRLPVGYSAR